jgi:hypothetical protein
MIDLRDGGADIFISSLMGGAHAMSNHFKDLAESRTSAPPLSIGRR